MPACYNPFPWHCTPNVRMHNEYGNKFGSPAMLYHLDWESWDSCFIYSLLVPEQTGCELRRCDLATAESCTNTCIF